MSEQTEQIMYDKRPIQMVWSVGSEDEMIGATVGRGGVTRIEPYNENGQMAAVTWFAVYKGDFLTARLNGACMAEITYAESQP